MNQDMAGYSDSDEEMYDYSDRKIAEGTKR